MNENNYVSSNRPLSAIPTFSLGKQHNFKNKIVKFNYVSP